MGELESGSKIHYAWVFTRDAKKLYEIIFKSSYVKTI